MPRPREHEIVLYTPEGTELASVRVMVRRSRIELISRIKGAASVLVIPEPDSK